MRLIMVKFAIIFTALIALASCNSSSKQSTKTEKKPIITNDSLYLDSLNQAISENPRNSALMAERAEYYLTRGKLTNAANDWARANTLDSLNPLYYIQLADLYLQFGKSERTHALLSKANQLIPGNDEILCRLGNLYLYVKDYQESINYYNQGIEIAPNNPLLYFGKGLLFAETGDTAKAITMLQFAVERDPEFIDAYNLLGHIHANRKDSLAIAYFNNSLNIDPVNYEAMYAKAMFYQNNFNIDEAISVYNKMLRNISPELSEIYYNIGYNYMIFKEDYAKAAVYFDSTIIYRPEYAEAFTNKAYCYEQLKDYKTARQLYMQALNLKPNLAPAVKGLNRLDSY